MCDLISEVKALTIPEKGLVVVKYPRTTNQAQIHKLVADLQLAVGSNVPRDASFVFILSDISIEALTDEQLKGLGLLRITAEMEK